MSGRSGNLRGIHILCSLTPHQANEIYNACRWCSNGILTTSEISVALMSHPKDNNTVIYILLRIISVDDNHVGSISDHDSSA